MNIIEFLEPLHPKVVHFPIALFLTACVFELMSALVGNRHACSLRKTFHQCAVCLYVLAALMTPLVVRTGLWEAQKLGLSHPLLDQHKRYALWTMWTTLMSLPVLWFFHQRHQKIFRILFALCLLASAAFVTLTADRRGMMVYEYGVGVES